mgnify:CR=1 FL=1
MQIVIEKSIPISTKESRSQAFREAFKKMEIGDSFLVLSDGEKTLARVVAHNEKIKITTRKHDVTRHRIWLVGRGS